MWKLQKKKKKKYSSIWNAEKNSVRKHLQLLLHVVGATYAAHILATSTDSHMLMRKYKVLVVALFARVPNVI